MFVVRCVVQVTSSETEKSLLKDSSKSVTYHAADGSTISVISSITHYVVGSVWGSQRFIWQVGHYLS